MAFKKYFNKRDGVFILIDYSKLKDSKKKASEMGLTLTEYIDLLLTKDLGIRKDRVKSQKNKIVINKFVKLWFDQSKEIFLTINRMTIGNIRAIKNNAVILFENDFTEFCYMHDIEPEKKYIKQIEYLLLRKYREIKNQKPLMQAELVENKKLIYDIIDGEKILRSSRSTAKPLNLPFKEF